jgi:hypothetical protein
VNAGRSTEVKKAFYRKIADDLHSKAGVRKQDVFINLVDVLPVNWSFGNGEMAGAPLANNAQVRSVWGGARERCSSCGPQSGSSVYDSARAIPAN